MLNIKLLAAAAITACSALACSPQSAPPYSGPEPAPQPVPARYKNTGVCPYGQLFAALDKCLLQTYTALNSSGIPEQERRSLQNLHEDLQQALRTSCNPDSSEHEIIAAASRCLEDVSLLKPSVSIPPELSEALKELKTETGALAGRTKSGDVPKKNLAG